MMSMVDRTAVRMVARVLVRVLVMTGVLGAPGGVRAEQPEDPLEGLNRRIFQFNDAVDSWVLRPVARGYDEVTPDRLQRHIGNVFDNLEQPFVALNQVLQGKPRAGLEDFTRFLVNSTVGIAGVFDVAARNGLPRRNEDYGQTLAVWSGGQGVYLVVPFRGPATTTHATGMVLSALTSPLRLLSSTRNRIIVGGVDVIDTRAQLLSAERLIQGDKYLFIRDAYLQSREFEINDGRVEEDPFLDDF